MSVKKDSTAKVNNLSLNKEAIAQLSDSDLQNVTGGMEAAGDLCIFGSSSCTIVKPTSAAE